MPLSSRTNHRWGVILAGGDGERLRRLTKFIAGDDRPKQFCPLLEGGRTLLEGTKSRIASAVAADRTLYLLTRNHEPFFGPALADVPDSLRILQPSNRGTLAAILCGLTKIFQVDPDAVIAFFPSDHYYSRERVLIQGISNGFAAAETVCDSVVLLGAKAVCAETGYGYIEPGAELPAGGGKLRRVRSFWEKPAPDLAQDLLEQGCLWNTFVMFGRARTFLSLIESAVPALYRAFEPMLSTPMSPAGLEEIYNRIPVADFSKLVLANGVGQTAVLDLGDLGWSDLGDPQRVIATLSAHGIPSPWRQLWMREMGIAPVAG
jgi:mannose-1-phosphate guanylyltransferase